MINVQLINKKKINRNDKNSKQDSREESKEEDFQNAYANAMNKDKIMSSDGNYR